MAYYRINWAGGIAMRHRLHIGTIVSDSMMKVKFMGGGLYRCDRRIFYFAA